MNQEDSSVRITLHKIQICTIFWNLYDLPALFDNIQPQLQIHPGPWGCPYDPAVRTVPGQSHLHVVAGAAGQGGSSLSSSQTPVEGTQGRFRHVAASVLTHCLYPEILAFTI